MTQTKRGNRFSILFLLTAFVLSHHVKAQNFDVSSIESYVIIGAFKVERNANNFSSLYQSKSLSNEVRWNAHRNLYYVYSFKSKDVEEARSKVFEVREIYPSLQDTWLYNGDFNGVHVPTEELVAAQKSIQTRVDEPIIEPEVEPEPVVAELKPEEMIKTPPREEKPGIKYVFFNTFNKDNYKEIVGDVVVFDAVRDKRIKLVKSLETVEIPDPKNGSQAVKFSSDIFGFREVEIELALDNPTLSGSDNVAVQGDSIIVHMPLERYNKGDIMTMWKVFFYIDAAIMKEESVAELNQLLNMLREDESMRIRIHGHTNGNSHGDVLHLDLDDKEFFSLNGSHEKATASAKKLSLFRAHTIKYWLMDQGIAEERMELKGWGGKKMLHGKHSSEADKNVRVEIEILDKT